MGVAEVGEQELEGGREVFVPNSTSPFSVVAEPETVPRNPNPGGQVEHDNLTTLLIFHLIFERTHEEWAFIHFLSYLPG